MRNKKIAFLGNPEYLNEDALNILNELKVVRYQLILLLQFLRLSTECAALLDILLFYQLPWQHAHKKYRLRKRAFVFGKRSLQRF